MAEGFLCVFSPLFLPISRYVFLPALALETKSDMSLIHKTHRRSLAGHRRGGALLPASPLPPLTLQVSLSPLDSLKAIFVKTQGSANKGIPGGDKLSRPWGLAPVGHLLSQFWIPAPELSGRNAGLDQQLPHPAALQTPR